MKIVVTGGAGFVGANLCRQLTSEPSTTEVVVIDDLSTGYRSNLDGVDVRLIEASILDETALAEAIDGAEAVVHLAAIPSVPRSVANPVASHEANATGTLRVLEAVRQAGGGAQVIVASSSSVYGANPELPKRESMRCMPMSPYAVSKLATESYALAYRHCYGLDVLAFRFFNIFGPLQAAGHAYAAVIPAFVDAALRGVPLPVHGDGTQSRDFTYVGTVARVISDAIHNRVSYQDPVNLAFGTRSTLLDVIAMLEEQLGHPVERQHTANRPGDVPHSQADSSSLSELFPGVEPVPFDEGLAATIAWHRSRAVKATPTPGQADQAT